MDRSGTPPHPRRHNTLLANHSQVEIGHCQQTVPFARLSYNFRATVTGSGCRFACAL